MFTVSTVNYTIISYQGTHDQDMKQIEFSSKLEFLHLSKK